MARAKRRGGSLGLQLFLILAVVVVGTVGGAAFLIWSLGDGIARRAVEAEMSSQLRVQTSFQQQRYQQLQLISRIFKTDVGLPSVLAEATDEGDVAAILDVVEVIQDILIFDLAVVLDRDGRVVTRTDDPTAQGADLSQTSLLQVARQEEIALGVWQEGKEGEKLYHAVVVPLVREFQLVGYIVVGYAVDNALAIRVGQVTGSDVVFLSSTGPKAAGSTVPPQRAEELVRALRLSGDVLNRVLVRGEAYVRVDELELGGEHWVAFLTPLRGAAEEPVGAVVALTSLDAKLAPYRQVVTFLAALGAGALGIGALLTWLLAGTVRRPLRRLAVAVDQAREGRFDAPLPSGGGPVGAIGASLAAFLGEIGERRSLEAVLRDAGRKGPTEGHGAEAPSRPRARKVALVAVEMRRFANPKLGYDPEEGVGRYGRDLRRLAASVQSRRGHLETVGGHRVLASFEGEGAALRAFTAATEIAKTLAEPENVFDEPDPPVVALTAGNVVGGAVVWGDRPGQAILGLPVQQIESLLREATPGELCLSKQIYAELAAAIEGAGVTVRPQRGVVSPQPLYPLSAEVAGRIAGIDKAPAAGGAFPGERRSLSEVASGAVLGDRFEVLAELGSGRSGTVFEARDRQHDQLVRLRLFKPEVAGDPAHVDRLRSRVRQARSVRHPGVLGTLDLGEVDGLIYATTEYAPGVTLRTLLEAEGALPLAAGVGLARQLAAGLAAAHAERSPHLGVKPENVLVEPSATARWMDLGVALPARGGLGPIDGAQYLAPEQLERGEGDARSDVYALGAVLYEVFTGRVPFSGASTTELRLKHAEEELAPPRRHRPDLPPRLDELVRRCLAHDPAARLASGQEVRRALEAALSG